MSIQKPVTEFESPAGLKQVHQYQLVRTLGAGGMGVVYEAFHVHLRRRVALKVLSPQLAASPYAIHRFEREMVAIGQLSHPNIVQALDAGVDATTHYLAMEFVDGVNVESLCQYSGQLRVADACEIVRQAALGLAHAHSFGIVHRDVKPSNLLLSKTGEVKVADLGLARFHDLLEKESLTAHGAVLGTYDYMSPEQARGETVGPASDLYNLGATFFRLLIGRAPFSGPDYGSSAQKICGHLNDAPPRLATLRSGIPPVLDDLMQRLLAKNPSERPSSAKEVLDVLAPLSQSAHLTALIETVARPPTSEITTQSLFSGPTKDLTTPRRLNRGISRLWLGMGGIITLACLAAFWFVVLRPPAVPQGGSGNSSPEPNRPSPAVVFEDLTSEELELMRWYPLLNREPGKVIWPIDALSSISFDPARSKLSASCSAAGVLSLGRIDVKGYKLRLDLHQSRWQGGVGVILGLRHHPDVPGGFVGQGFLLQLTEVRDRTRRLSLRRAKLALLPRPEGDFRVQRLATFDAPVNMPAGTSETIEFVALPEGVSQVRWAGADVPSLCTPAVNREFEPQDYRGEFGLLLSESDVTVSSVQLMPISR